MNKDTKPDRIRPGFLVLLLAVSLAAVLMTLWMRKPGPAPAPESDPIATAADEGGVDAGMGTGSHAGTAAEGSIAPLLEVAPAGDQPAALLLAMKDPREIEYQQRVSQAVERAYNSQVPPTPGDLTNNMVNPLEPGGLQTGSGMRDYITTERARRALIEELRLLRRAYIATANAPVTNQ